MKITKSNLPAGKVIASLNKGFHISTVADLSESKASKTITVKGTKSIFKKPLDIKFNISYPLNVTVEVESKGVTSIGSLVWRVAKAYKDIYEEEENSAKIKTKPGNERGMLLNRNKTNGVFGIWGHDMGDLYLVGMEICDNGVAILHIGS